MVVNERVPGHIDLPFESPTDKAIYFSDLLPRYLASHYNAHVIRPDVEFVFLCAYVSVVGVYFHEIGHVRDAVFWMTQCVGDIAEEYQRTGLLCHVRVNMDGNARSIREVSIAVAHLLQQLEDM